MEENYISEQTLITLNQLFNDFFYLKYQEGLIWLSPSIKLFELYLPILKYEYLNTDIKSNSIYQFNRFIDSYLFLKNSNIISNFEFEKFEAFLIKLPKFDYANYKNNKNYIIPEDTLENFGYLNAQNIIFLNNNSKVIIDIILLEENLRNF